ncbi:MAG: N-formylglutamate amidohydrolase [Polyangiaceae bacterium]|nr:N-formylglutamate amidohydrolase [Polyangiaceae bacterium]
MIEPPTVETPLVVEIPHAGIAIDAPSLAYLAAPACAIGRDADLYVDELYANAPSCGATLIVAHISRYVVDLNRGERDIDSDAVEGATGGRRATRGVVWRLTSEGARALERPLPGAELERRLQTHYRPYHAALAQTIERKRRKFGFALVLAAHSMPSMSRDGQMPRADLVPGTRGGTSAARSFIDTLDVRARASGLSVTHDDPYQGGYTTLFYGQPNLHVHVIQLELARRLYMDETMLVKNDRFDRTREFCTDLVSVLGRTIPKRS